MFLIYVDESGDPSSQNEEYFVLGAVAIYESQAFFLSKKFDEIQSSWIPSASESVEFHASEIFNRHCEPWKSLGKEKCLNLLYDLCDSFASVQERGLVLFGVAVHRKSFSEQDPVEKAFHELCGHFDKFIDQANQTSKSQQKNRGLMIMDSARYRGHLDKLLLEYRRKGGTKFGRVRNFADAPAFADSKTTRLLQAADLVSYAIFKRYEKGDARLLDRLLRRFQKSEGVYHGLVHLVNNYLECPCPACLGRSIIAGKKLSPPPEVRVDDDNAREL